MCANSDRIPPTCVFNSIKAPCIFFNACQISFNNKEFSSLHSCTSAGLCIWSQLDVFSLTSFSSSTFPGSITSFPFSTPTGDAPNIVFRFSG
ncbi:hypothetical protein GDO81_013951 [Engystomops pustulosus]|uniref:Uncharacterized protein n=1 Tax=Engystomops pustulosus TaxID=76066 RepID=A0AAV7B721_ENGPU|nr:hypothetical protein GDO81_013951 [Engystomops pustulosus]